MIAKKKKKLLLVCSILAVVSIITLYFTFRAHAATGTGSVTDLDWGYMWWLSNSSTQYDHYNGAYHENFSDPPKYPDDKYSRWCYDEGPIGTSGWQIDSSRGIRWASDVNLPSFPPTGRWPYGMPINPTYVEHTSGQGWWGQGVWNHYRKPCVVYYKRVVQGKLTMSTKYASYDMGANSSINITVSLKGYAPIDNQRILNPRLSVLNYSINTTGKTIPIGITQTDPNTHKFNKSENPESYSYPAKGAIDFTINVNTSDLKIGDNVITVNGEFAVPIVTGINDDTTATSYIKASLPITVKVGQAAIDSTLPNLKPTNVTIFDGSNKVDSVKPGKKYTALVDITNNGGADASATNTALYLDDNYSSNVPTPLIAKGANTSVKIDFTATSFSQKITAEVNYQKTIEESCYTDNRYTVDSAYVPIGPNVNINAPIMVTMGQHFAVTGSGQSTESTVTSLQGHIFCQENDGVGFPILGGQTTLLATDKNKSTSFGGMVWFGCGSPPYNDYVRHVYSTVVDNNGMTATSEVREIQVIHPVPSVVIEKSGTFKKNRKMIIDASNSSANSDEYGIDWSKTTWEVTVIPGGDNTDSDIRIQSHTSTPKTNGTVYVDSSNGINKSLDGLKTFDLQCKKTGSYMIKCTITNVLGFSSTNSLAIFVVPDAPPIAKCYGSAQNNYRDPNDNYQYVHKAFDDGTQENGSYSPDGDTIAKRAWLVSFDSNNNHIYTDDKWYLVNSNGSLTYVGNYAAAQNVNLDLVGNDSVMTFKSTHPGNYVAALIVREEFGQDYIPQFVSSSDRESASTFPK